MSHDYDGTADNPRNEREREDHENVSSFPEGHADVNAGAEDGCRHDELANLKEEAIRKALTDISGADLGEAIAEVEIAKYAEWAGLLPDPESFAQYPEYAQRAMVEWNNANIIGGSKRMDKMVDSAINLVGHDEGYFYSAKMAKQLGIVLKSDNVNDHLFEIYKDLGYRSERLRTKNERLRHRVAKQKEVLHHAHAAPASKAL